MRLVSIPEAHKMIEEAIPSIKGRLVYLRKFTEGPGRKGGKWSLQFGLIKDASDNEIKVKFSYLGHAVNPQLIGREVMFQSTKGKKKSDPFRGLSVTINENKDQSRETVLLVTNKATFFEDIPDAPLPEPQFASSKPRFETSDLKSMEKNHATNGKPTLNVPLPPLKSEISNLKSDEPRSSLTTVFNPEELISIRDRAAKLCKETTDPFLKRAYCAFAEAAHNLNANLLCPVK